MFPKEVYIKRRKALKAQICSGIALFLGNSLVPFNYPANPYSFRQDSSFLYFFGIDEPDMAAIIDFDTGDEILFGQEVDIDDIIWSGQRKSLHEQANEVGISKALPFNKLKEFIDRALEKGRKIHFLPPYRSQTKYQLSNLLGLKYEAVNKYVSVELIKAVVKLRSVKDEYEIAEIERMVDVAYQMHTTAMRMAKPGILEREIAGTIEGISLSNGGPVSFPVIVTVHGEILHNNFYGNKLKKGDLLLVDAGAESSLHYASDITRVSPVGGKFDQRQRDIYQIVLEANMRAIEDIKPGKPYIETHYLAAKIIAQGLKDLGLMRANVDEAVQAGAHALFFPHGLGHMLGLDVHDMEGLGEDYVGYDDKYKRIQKFGIGFLRLAKPLQPGYVLTVEPGIYFIPELINQWQAAGKFKDFINYDKVEKFKDFGGIRIEDDVLITETGAKVLGKPIPKAIDDVEAIVNQ